MLTSAVEDIAAQRERAAPVEPAGHRPADPRRGQQRRGEHRDRDRPDHLRGAEAEHEPAHRRQLREVELQPQREHQEHDAELGERVDRLGVRREVAGVGTEHHADQQVGHQRRHAERTQREHRDDARGEQQQRDLEGREHRAEGGIRGTWSGARTAGRARTARYTRPMTDPIVARHHDADRLVAQAREVLRIEADAVASLVPRIGAEFAAACGLILACTGRVVVSGMGKSGHVARKLAATLASTGTPAFFVHPAEA
ncbi:MAG TPA: SIS domain-containing protein, partial [Burkholderiaceae bacterium]|nr:SIS domain-containing protein [Burkholderiaceae bacterium]